MTDGRAQLDVAAPARPLIVADSSNVTALRGPSRIEPVVKRLRRAILCGDLLPGQILRLASIADNHRVRLSTLRLLLERLRDEQLLTFQGDVAIVKPLDWNGLQSVQNMWRSRQNSMLRTSMEALGPADLRTIDQILGKRAYGPGRADFVDGIIANEHKIVRTLYRPAMPKAGDAILGDILTYIVRYHVFVENYLNYSKTGIAEAFTEAQRESLRLLQAGQYDLAFSAQTKVYAAYLKIEQIAFESPWARGTPDDQPEARVIPFRAR